LADCHGRSASHQYLRIEFGDDNADHFVFFGLLTVVLYRNILQANEKSPRRFVTAFMGSVTIKLLVTLAFLGIYLYFDRVNKIPVALGFFVIYIAYTIVLVKSLTTHLGNTSETK
jgi:uncharacterized membrane protein YobD (UPF0266 family)